jgi:hypothetical protein
MRNRLLLPAAIVLMSTLPAGAAEVSAFLAVAKPGENWAGGAGGAFGITLLQALQFEAEGARMPGEIPDQSQWSLVGSALLAPSFGRLIPYAGLGVGGYWQKELGRNDTGIVRNVVLGVKLKLGLALVKAEYRKVSLPEEALVEMRHRFSVGAGVSF